MMTDAFETSYRQGRSQMLVRTLPADLDTPVSAALKMLGERPYNFVLESVEGGEARGRYSFIGWAPDMLWRCKGGAAETATLDPCHSNNAPVFQPAPQPPLEALQLAVSAAKIDQTGYEDIPVPGLVGYLGYDMVRHIEHLPNRPQGGLGMADALLMRPTMVAIFDTVKDELSLAAIVRPMPKQTAAQAFHQASKRLDDAIAALSKEVSRHVATQGHSGDVDIRVNVSRAAYCQNVETAKELIKQGDIFQVVLSRRFEMPFSADSFSLYRALRRLNPAPFLFHLKLGDASLIGSSPEILVRVRSNTVTLRPIAGTRPRGKTPAEDARLEQDLLNDPKERAEHLMLLDLGRNDVGRVAEPSSVKVTQAFQTERYSHVMHIVSNVEGTLKADESVTSALFAGFPAGTVSGAPKVRAMEIIDAMEKDARGPYAGAVGYFGTNGDMDSCIVLRTAILKDETLYIQAGAGIVADSDPMSEALECEHKAKAIIAAAQSVLDTQ
ncbi:MAG: anthranilate synthase component I [Pseudomonadota bacterium]